MKKRACLGLCVVFIAACSTVQDSTRSVDNSSNYPTLWLDPGNCSVVSSSEEARELLASFSALSTNSYLEMDEELGCRKLPPDQRAADCPGFVNTDRDWEIIGGSEEESSTGFDYRIYRNPGKAERKPILVFAFRGTESFRDWRNNFYLFNNGAPPQSREALAAVTGWLAQNRPEGDMESGVGIDEEIYAVGHSLGGAIAQYIAYVVPSITAIVFNPSPRTGYLSISPDDYQNPTVCRIWESYEALRTATGAYVPRVTPNHHSCGYINQQSVFSPISAHNMQAIAKALACYAQNGELSLECREIVARKGNAMPGEVCR